MKKLSLFLAFVIFYTTAFTQVDSISFKPSSKAEIMTSNVSKIKINDVEVSTNGENSKYLTINSFCNFTVPTYDQLTGGGSFVFRRIKSDAQASISALGSSLSFDKKSDYYVFYFTRSRTYKCNQLGQSNDVTFGIGVYIMFKVSEVKGGIKINTPYDISAAGQLGLAKIELDVKTYGMRPTLQSEFMPEKLSDIAIESAKYFDKVVTAARTLINDANTEPNILPVAL